MPTHLFHVADCALWRMALQTWGDASPCNNPVSFHAWGAAGLALPPCTLLSVHPSCCHALPAALPSPISPSHPSLSALLLRFPSPREQKEGQSQQGLNESTFGTVPTWVPCAPWLYWGWGPAAPTGTQRTTPQPSGAVREPAVWLRPRHLEVTCTLCPRCGDSRALLAAQLLFLAVWGRSPAASSASGQRRAGSQQLLPFHF